MAASVKGLGKIWDDAGRIRDILSGLEDTEVETLLKMDLTFFSRTYDLEYLLEMTRGQVTEEAAAYLSESVQDLTEAQYKKAADVISGIWKATGESTEKNRVSRVINAVREDEGTAAEITEMLLKTVYDLEYLLETVKGKVTEEAFAYLQKSARELNEKQYKTLAESICRVKEITKENVNRRMASEVVSAVRKDTNVSVDEVIEKIFKSKDVSKELIVTEGVIRSAMKDTTKICQFASHTKLC